MKKKLQSLINGIYFQFAFEASNEIVTIPSALGRWSSYPIELSEIRRHTMGWVVEKCSLKSLDRFYTPFYHLKV